MTWIPFDKEKPPEFKDLLVIKQYLDAPYGQNGYETEKSFWTEPTIMIDSCWQNCWGKGGRVTHWMPLPEAPKED